MEIDVNNESQFIKMCWKCAEFKFHNPWEPAVGDIVWHRDKCELGIIDEYELYKPWVVNGKSYDWGEAIVFFSLLPSKKQLKKMIDDYSDENFRQFIDEPSYNPNNDLEKVKNYCATEKERLLAYVIKRQYKMWWTGIDWRSY